MPEQIIKDRLTQLDPAYRSFVTSDEPSTIVQSLAEIHNLDEISLLALENGFLLLLLFLLSKNDFTVFIVEECHISAEQAVLLTSAFLLALPADIRTAYENSVIQTTEQSESKLLNEIKEAEDLLNTMPTLNTMTAPEAGETTYTSTQSAILQDSLHNLPVSGEVNK